MASEPKPPHPHPLDALRAYVATHEEYFDDLPDGWDLSYANGKRVASLEMLALATEALAAVERERDEARAAVESEHRIAVSAYAQRFEAFTRERSALAALRGLVEHMRKDGYYDDPANPPSENDPSERLRHEWTALEHIADALRLPPTWGKMSLLMAVRDVVQHLRPFSGETMADASKRYVAIAEQHVEILDAAVTALNCDKYTRIAWAAEELRAESATPRLGDTVVSYSRPEEPGEVVRIIADGRQCEVAPGAAPGLVRVEDRSSLHVVRRAGEEA